ncbi:MAG: DUF72 domain-containing protein [Actinophytocola sp.]|nr:DUF72 domain-containing protein [Actinophytocola sp.]
MRLAHVVEPSPSLDQAAVTDRRQDGAVGEIRIGTSGWVYDSWRGPFYPADLPRRRQLEYLSRQMRTAELNGSFYSLQRPERYRGWRDAVPPATSCSR